MAVLSPSDTETAFLTLRYRRGFRRVFRPTLLSVRMKGCELPSMMGTSKVSTSTIALSMPRPLKAESRCSTVCTRVPFTPRVVASVVSVTF